MKPRTKLQREVIKRSIQLRKINKKERDWARHHCFEHKGFATKTRVICMDCGESFSPDLIHRKRAVCPHCKTQLKIDYTRKRTDKQEAYFTIAEVYSGFQVIRYWEIIIYYKKGEKARVFIWEVLQHWISLENWKYEVVARIHNLNYVCDSWSGEMQIRKEYSRWQYSRGNKYDIYPTKIHPDSIFYEKYKYHGIDYRLRGLTPLEAISFVPKNSRAETLLKAKQYSFLNNYHAGRGGVSRYWSSVKICMRNKYRVKDASMYFDYLDALNFFHKDLRNAHYVCPKNLKKAHDYYVDKRRRAIEKQEEEEKRKKAIENTRTFVQLKQPYFGIAFSKGELNIKVLESIEEYMEEGDKLHHCVFTNEYYLKPDSLVLSARINDEPVETIEVSLDDFSILQARGRNNLPTKHHDKIVELVNKGIPQIRKRLKTA
ncbi:PcfJ domain-containing protein [Mariniphaga sediminis]|uniref:PcfJ domain-containing protein n=1 Tax=Mariniphaga sediminis TaxID=1628158 RepID=UPI003563C159